MHVCARVRCALGFQTILLQAILDKAPDLASIAGKVAPQVLELVERSLKKDPDRRWQTAKQMQAGVRECLELLPRFWSGERLVAFASSLREYLGKMPDRGAADRRFRNLHRAVADHDPDVCRWGAVLDTTPPPWAAAQRAEHSHRNAFEHWNAKQAAAFGLLKYVRDCASHKVAGCDDETIGARAFDPSPRTRTAAARCPELSDTPAGRST